ncbi:MULTISPECIES: hypothetical protein [Flavobacteriaceae]|uniref:DUF4878 domain-containing protein n=2 Tax=Flavobacteriaceae TaxID=49546 RepID=A0A918S643_9FLAO|nr:MULTISPECIES: hypothetical protein [Flavobacteriaceae]MDT0686414.1 hypothetical protein [Zunongwangia sp. F225]GHA24942.1 hypothetical protein GCM10007103_02720 [Salinimicrobium marinum]
MKRVLLYSIIIALVACNEKQMSHTETAKIVAESFYHDDKATLEKYTTPDIYANFITIQDLYSGEEEVNFEISEEQSNDQTAWVKFTTTFTDEPETFKLVKQDGQWKVTERSEGERPPF